MSKFDNLYQPVCGTNEQWNECGSYCGDSECFKPDPEFCREDCLPRCECIPGYIRDPAGNCIEESTCVTPKGCPPNMELKECGNACKEPKCSGNSDFCPEICEKRCECMEGFVRDDSTGQCVKPYQCTQECRGNEVWNTCLVCQEQSCFNQEPACIACFTGEDCCLSAQCVCKDGLYRNHKGFCVELDRCPNRPKCGENEEWTECGNQCTESACCPVNSKCSEPICAQEIIKN